VSRPAAPPLLRLPALSLGPEVAALRRGPGRVLAVVGGAVYLTNLEGYVVALVDEAAPDGPLSLRVRGFPALRQAAARAPDASYRPTPDGLEIAGAAVVTCAGAPEWTPRLPRPGGPAGARRAAALALRDHLHRDGGAAGCAPLASYALAGAPLPPRLAADPCARRLHAALTALGEAIRVGDPGGAGRAAGALLGLGPGLTPSGDDALAGALAAVLWQEDAGGPLRATAEAIAAVARDEAPRRTTRLSARLLHPAGRGLLYAPALAAGAALLAGDAAALERAVPALFALGATTGRDVATGLLLGVLASHGDSL
jgi:hypothetical protein